MFLLSHRPAAFGDDDFVVEAVFPQHFLAADALAIFHQPLAQWLINIAPAFLTLGYIAIRSAKSMAR